MQNFLDDLVIDFLHYFKLGQTGCKFVVFS